jgi:Poxvirus Late Transcription Factor VLTF3 like
MSSNQKKNIQAAQTKSNPNTIDEKHTEMLNLFHEIETTTIPNLLAEKTRLKDLIPTLKDHQIDEYMDIRDKILAIQVQMRSLKSQKKQYLLENSKYIFDYFEQKKQISNTSNLTNQNANVLNTFFKIKSATQNPEAANPNSDKYSQSKKAYRNYWRNVNNEITNIQDFVINSDVCEICHKGELIPQDEEGILICNNQGCGKFITYIIDSSKPTNKEPPNEVSYTAYIRLNHFKEILSQFQAKETTQIPEEVIDAIKARIKKERILDMSLINYDKMRDILRKLGLNKYFEHIQYINSLFGIKPPIMNEELHETLCVLFIEIQKPWAVHCPANRTNFFNYTYTLYQLCVLLDQTQYLPYIPMMKDREKQLEQDMIWKKVCNDLDWEFCPTV